MSKLFLDIIKKACHSRSFIFVEDDECGDDARHPPATGEDKHNEYRPAPAVDDGQRREEDGQEDAEEGHNLDDIIVGQFFAYLKNWHSFNIIW